MAFRVPADTKPRKTRYWVDEFGHKWRSIGNAMWLTNLDTQKRHQELVLTKHYNPELYPKYDNYLAFEVGKVADIPKDDFIDIEIPDNEYDKWKAAYGDNLTIIE